MKKRPYGTGRVYKPAGCQYFYIQYWQGGKQIRESSRSTTKSVAEALLRERLTGRDNGRLPIHEQKKLTYADLRQMLLDHYTTQKNKSLQTLSDGTETIWGLSALDGFFGYGPDNPGPAALTITNASVAKFIRERRGEGVADSTIHQNLRLLRRMFGLAKQQEKLSQVPVLTMPPAGKARTDFIREPQLDALLAELPERLRPYIAFLFYQGTRSGEAKQLVWGQIDLERATYRPDAAANKTGDAKVRPLHNRVLSYLRGAEKRDPDERVFDTTDLRNRFETARAKLGLNILLLGLRRSCVVYYREHGVDDATIRKITGHKSLAVFDDYNVVDLKAMQRAMRTAAGPRQLTR